MVSKSKAVLGELTPNNVGQLKTINSVLFPVYYNEKFYKNALESGELAKLGETSGNILNSHFLQIRIRIRIRMEKNKKIKKMENCNLLAPTISPPAVSVLIHPGFSWPLSWFHMAALMADLMPILPFSPLLFLAFFFSFFFIFSNFFA